MNVLGISLFFFNNSMNSKLYYELPKSKPDVPKWFENDLKNILVFSGSKNNK